MAQINWGIIVSIASLLITVYTIIKTNAKSEEKMQGQIEVIKNDIKHLSNKVEKHNSVVERVYELESKVDVLDEKQDVANHRISDLESESQSDIREIKNKLINMTRRN